MLVLTRKQGQKLMIGNDVVITILEVRGDSVKVGIDAPRQVAVYREEIYQEIIKTNQQAMAATPEVINLEGLTLPSVPAVKP